MIHIMSFNIRVDVKSDGIYQWSNRKDKVISFINEQSPDILALQEANPNMLEYLKMNLDTYDFFVEPRDEGGESIPLLIKKGFGKLIEAKTVWLTDTPHQKSKVDGSYYPRIATYAIIETNTQGKLGVFNIHLDNSGDLTTHVQVKKLHTYINKLQKKIGFKSVILGDFNATPSSNTIEYMKKYYFQSYREPSTEQLTFHNYSVNKIGEPIDYIFLDKTLPQKSSHIIRYDKESMLSDHYPIEVKL